MTAPAPEQPVLGRVVRRVAALAAVAVVLGLLVLPWRPPTLCLLRGLTGVPCPFCGGTTALVHLGRADLAAALRASPLVVLGAPVWVAWPGIAPAVGRAGRRLLGGRRSTRAAWAAGVLVMAASEAWQLHRFA